MKLRTTDLTAAAMFVALNGYWGKHYFDCSVYGCGGSTYHAANLFCNFSRLVLGSRLGAIAMMVYATCWVGWSSGFCKIWRRVCDNSSALHWVYIVSIYFHCICNWKHSGKERERAGSFMLAALVGMAMNYLFGTNWMYYAYKVWASAPDGFTYKMAWLWMAVPLPKDIILAILAGLMALCLERTLSRSQVRNFRKVS